MLVMCKKIGEVSPPGFTLVKKPVIFFSLFSSRICSFLPLLSLSREISCKQRISSLQMNKNGGHDLVRNA